MKKRLGIALGIAMLAALFASQYPDGLDKVSQMLGFEHKGTENQAVLAGYALPWFGESKLSTITAGVIGVLAIYGLFLLAGYVLRKYRSEQDQTGS